MRHAYRIDAAEVPATALFDSLHDQGFEVFAVSVLPRGDQAFAYIVSRKAAQTRITEKPAPGTPSPDSPLREVLIPVVAAVAGPEKAVALSAFARLIRRFRRGSS